MAFYNHNLYQPTYQAVREALKEFLSEQVFRFDKSRVIVASNEYAFRRRYELTDVSKDFNNIKAMSLHMPFCNINPFNTGWEFDDAPASRNASMVYDGIYEGTTRLRASRVVQNIPCTFYFDNEPDARLAYDKMHFLSFVEHDLSYNFIYGGKVQVDEDGGLNIVGGETIALPVVLEFKSLKFNPTFNEKSWLEQQRMFIITAEIEVRSFALYPLNQPKFEGEITAESYDSGVDDYVLTDKVVMAMGSDFKSSFYIKNSFEELEGIEVKKEGVYYLDASEGKFYTWDKKNEIFVSNGSNAFLVINSDDVYDAPWHIERTLVSYEEYCEIEITATYNGEYDDDGNPTVTIDDIGLYLGTSKEKSLSDWTVHHDEESDTWTYSIKYGVEYPSVGSDNDIYDDVDNGGYKVWMNDEWVNADSDVQDVNHLSEEEIEKSHEDDEEWESDYVRIPKYLTYVVEKNEDDEGYHYQLNDTIGDGEFVSNIQDLEVPTEDMEDDTFDVYTYMTWSDVMGGMNTVSRIYVTEDKKDFTILGDHEVEIIQDYDNGRPLVRTVNEKLKDTRIVGINDLLLLPVKNGSVDIMYKMLVDQFYIYRKEKGSFSLANHKSPCFLRRGDTYAGYLDIKFGGDTREEKERRLVTTIKTLPNEDDNRQDDLLHDWTPSVLNKDVLIDDDRVVANPRLSEEHTIVGIHW